jgi:DNA primase
MQQDSGYQNVTPEDFLDHEGIDYRRTSGSRGPQFNIKECPACGGSAWKVYLSVDTGYGNCFHGSCGLSFNLWTFAKAHLGTEDSKAIGQLFDTIAKGIGWKPKPRAPKSVAKVFEGDLKLPMSLPADTAGIPYMNERGVPARYQQEFNLRWCKDGAFKYQREDGTPAMMPFSGRIIIPIHDLDGLLVTFQGRDITGESDRKYLFPPRLPSTGRFLYNGHRAFAERWSHIVMGEGALDVIATQMAIDGDRTFTGMGAVGSFGKKLTLDHEPGMETQLQALLRLKDNGTKIITILWDGERDAITSAFKAAKRLTALGFTVRIGFLPKGKDPAEVHPATVRKAIASALLYSRALEVKVRLSNPYGR